MAAPTGLLDLPVGRAVARVAQRYLKEASGALTRLRDPRDAEALHDFRVAIRRLRSLLGAYRRWIGRVAGNKVRRRLRELGRATNAGRDAEVQIVWLARQRDGLARRERAGLNWLLRRLRRERRDSYRAARKQVRAEFDRAAELLRGRLADAVPEDQPRFRDAFATLLREHAADLAERLAAIRGADDDEAAHEARISAKRLRYLLEPVRREVPAARGAVAKLKSLQDTLGALHDAHVLGAALVPALEEVSTEKARRMHALALAGSDRELARERRRDERHGLVALAARAHADQLALYAELDRAWLAGRGAELFATLAGIADTVGGAGPVPVERERKFLLRGVPPRAAGAPADEIHQGWLPGTALRERLRRAATADGERFFRTVKLGSGLERTELEEETTRDLFEALWPFTAGCRVHKDRHRVPAGALTWEIDVFRDRDLVLAEIEIPAADTRVRIPRWLAPFVVRDVTGDPAYVNLNLAR